jgi:hypothetical protein
MRAAVFAQGGDERAGIRNGAADGLAYGFAAAFG